MKTFRLFLLLSLSLVSFNSYADWGRFQSGVIVNGNYHDCYFNTVSYELQHSAFGRFTSAGSLVVNKAQMWTWKDQPNSNACGATLYYRVYRTCDTPPAFSSEALNWECNSPCAGAGANDQLWETDNVINLLSGLTLSGTYIFEMYFEYTGSSSSGGGCGEVRYDNNGSINNYRAYFEFENTDSFTDSTFTSPTWTSDNINNFLIINKSAVAGLNGTEPTHTRTVRLNSSFSGGGNEANYISTQIATWGAQQEWRFWLGRNGAGAANQSQSIVWLYADDTNLKSATVNGYRLQMGDNLGADEINFQKVVNGSATTLYSSSVSVPNGLTDYGISFYVTCSSAGVWNVWSTPLPQDNTDAQNSPSALGVPEAALTEHLFSNKTDPSFPIALAANGYFGFMTVTSSTAANRQSPEFDNFTFKALPPDTYFTFASAASSIDEDDSGNMAIEVQIHNPSTTNASSVEVVLVSGAAARVGGGDANTPHAPSYTTITLNWAANDNTPKYLYIDPDDNLLCDDHAYLTFELQSAAGGTNAFVGLEDTHVLTVLDDNMGYDNLASENFEVSLPASWISTPAGRWSRTNTNAVGGTGYSLGHNSFGSTDSSSIALSLDTMPLTGVTTTWRFQVRYNQDGTPNNHWLAFLSANTTNLRNLAAVSGYAIGFNQNVTGGSDDPLCLFKVTNGVHSVLINTGLDWLDDVGQNDAVSIEVILSEAGVWSVRVDLDGGFDNLTSYGATPTDLTFPLLSAYGARVNLTSGSSDKFRMDDISIAQKGCNTTWYSRGSNNNTAVVWASTPSGSSVTVTGNRYNRFVIQSGNTITANGQWIANDITIEPGATLTGQANTDLRLFGDWINDGTFNRGTSNVTFRGTENQLIGGEEITHFHNLTIDNDGGTVLVNPTDSIFIHNVAYVNEGTLNANGKLTLYSNSTASGSIGEIKPGGSVTGNVTLMRYIPSIPYQYGNWINLGNPLTGLTLAAWNASSGSGITTTGYTGSDFPPPYSFVNIRSYNEAVSGDMNTGYVSVASPSEELLSEKGYFVWLNGSAQTLKAKGGIQQGSITHNLSYTNNGTPTADGWNLMTNPYPSEVDFDLVSANFGPSEPRAFYVFDYETGSYKVYSYLYPNNTGSRYIPHSQSFLVKVNSTGQYLQYEESYKTNNNIAFERSINDSDAPVLAIQLERNGMRDENVVTFNENTTANYDNLDALHLASPNENSIQLSFMSEDNYALVLDSRPYNEEIVIPVKAKMPAAGTYNLIISQMGNLPAGACLFVEDIITGQTMRVTEGAEMQVTVNAPFEGIRFRITGSAPAKVITTDATCFGAADGTIDVTAPASWSVKLNDETHDFEYVSNGSVTLDGLRAGVYQLEVINPDAACTAEVKTFTIAEPAAITAAITTTEQVLCNEGNTGTVSWAVNNADWFSFEIKDESNTTVQTAEAEGTSYYAENLSAGLYTIKVYTECSTQTMTVDLRDANAPLVAVNAPETVALGNEAASVWLDAAVANAQSVSWTLSNGQTGEGEMFEAIVDTEGVYTYTATAKGNNCEKTVTGSFVVKSLALGTDAGSSAITLLQQPEQMILTLGAAGEGKATVRVIDAMGKLVINRDVTSEDGQTVVMNTTKLSTGVYTIQVVKGNDVLFTEKVFRK